MTSFDRHTPFTLAGVSYFKATARTDGIDPSVLIVIRDLRRRPRRGRHAPRDQFGNLPRGFTALGHDGAER